MNFPFIDDYLTYDYNSHRYVLTKKYVLEQLKVDIDARFGGDGEAVLQDVSEQVYDYMHEFSANTLYQDFIIAKTKGGRDIIKEAMSKQLKYVLVVGNLRYSTDERKRALWFDESAKKTLFKILPEIGTTICYTGTFRFCTNDYSRW